MAVLFAVLKAPSEPKRATEICWCRDHQFYLGFGWVSSLLPPRNGGAVWTSATGGVYVAAGASRQDFHVSVEAAVTEPA